MPLLFCQVLPSNLVCKVAGESLTDTGGRRRGKVVGGDGGGVGRSRGMKSADGSNECSAEGITGPLTWGFGSNIKVKTPFLLPRSLPVLPCSSPRPLACLQVHCLCNRVTLSGLLVISRG